METISLMSEIESHLIPPFKWLSGVGDLLLLPIFLISELLRAGQSIQQNVQYPFYRLTFISIQVSGPHRSNPSSFTPCAPVGSFPDTLNGVSGPAVTIALQIWPCVS